MRKTLAGCEVRGFPERSTVLLTGKYWRMKLFCCGVLPWCITTKVDLGKLCRTGTSDRSPRSVQWEGKAPSGVCVLRLTEPRGRLLRLTTVLRPTVCYDALGNIGNTKEVPSCKAYSMYVYTDGNETKSNDQRKIQWFLSRVFSGVEF